MLNQIIKEEVESRLRMLQALAKKQMIGLASDDEEIPKYFKMQLDQLKYIDCSIRAAIQDKEVF